MQVNCYVFITKLMATPRTFFSFASVKDDNSNCEDGVFFLLPQFAVLDHHEDVLEHLDTVQVSEETLEFVLSTN